MAGNLCRLCVNICSEGTSLYDENGHRTETYEITVNYFDISLLNEKRENNSTVMCLECWRHIIEFHNFRQSVLLAQMRLREDPLQTEDIAKSTADRNNDGNSELRYDDIVVKVEEDFVSPPVMKTINTLGEYPLDEACHSNAGNEICYGYIVKEEVEYVSPTEMVAMDCPTESPDSKNRATGNNNIFVTDEQELISLVSTTNKISFKKCMSKTESIMESFEMKPVISTALEKEASSDNCDTSTSYEDENVSSYDETYIQSEDEEDPISSYTGEVFKGDDELMDISESELESIDDFHNSDEDDVHSLNYSSNPSAAKAMSKLGKDVKPTIIVGQHKSPAKSKFTVAAGTSQKYKQTRNVSKKPLIKREKKLLAKSPTDTAITFLQDEQTKQLLKNHPIKREKRFPGECSIGQAIISQDDEPAKKMVKGRPLKSKREEELDDIIAQWKSNLQCMICNNSFTTYTLLREHYREKHPHEEFYILCCDIKIKKRGHLAEHIRLHIDPKAFKCAFCDKSCTRKRNLRLHMLNKHGITDCGDISYQDNVSSLKQQNFTRKKMKDSDEFIAQWLPNLECVVCKLSCSSFTLLQEHFRHQHPDKEFYILCCEFKLFERIHVAEHLRLHTHPRAFKCEQCSKCFTMKRTLDYHIHREHTAITTGKGNVSQDDQGNVMGTTNSNQQGKISKDQKVTVQESDALIAQWLPNLECGLCSKLCSSFTLLQKHFRQQHPNGNGYVLCCQRKFCHRDKLQRHIRVHLYPKGFKCELCGKRYSRECGLQNHVSKQHYISIDDDGVNKCRHNEKFSSNEGLDGYQTKPEFMDKSIKRKTIRELDDIIAQWRPSLECAVCNEAYTTFTLLQNHFRQRHPNVECYISCCQCKFPGRYDIEEHIRFHNDPNAFKCVICGRRFSRRRALNGHMRTHRTEQQ